LARTYWPEIPGQKTTMPAFSPAFYPKGVLRGRDHASGVWLLILDFDNSCEEVIPGEFHLDSHTGKPTGRPRTRKIRIEHPVTMADAAAQLRSTGVTFIAWTTYSCSSDHEKFRVVVPLAALVPVDFWGVASEWALTHLGLDKFRRGLDLPVLHNPTALAFLPGSPDPASIRRTEAPGEHLAIPLNAVIQGEAPRSPWAPWQNALLETRQAERDNGDQWWMAYRVNGRPVDFQSLDLASILESRGIKVGAPRPFKSGSKRRCCCPWAAEHTGGVDDDAAAVFHTPGSWPSFRCMHSGHSHLGLRDLLEWAWGRP